jgi:hypothetical protein
MKYLILFLFLIGCSRDLSFDPTITISKELIRFIYNESTKDKPVME